jgi:hypothetical protein
MPKITTTELLQEGNWRSEPWQTRLASDAAFQTWAGTIITRASKYVEWRVGTATYIDTAEPLSSILKEAEMHVAMEELLLSAAAIADNAAGAAAPFAAGGAELRAAADSRRRRAEPLLHPYDKVFGRPNWRRPRARAGAAMESELPLFDPGK